jgi:hypothetical protein
LPERQVTAYLRDESLLRPGPLVVVVEDSHDAQAQWDLPRLGTEDRRTPRCSHLVNPTARGEARLLGIASRRGACPPPPS